MEVIFLQENAIDNVSNNRWNDGDYQMLAWNLTAFPISKSYIKPQGQGKETSFVMNR